MEIPINNFLCSCLVFSLAVLHCTHLSQTDQRRSDLHSYRAQNCDPQPCLHWAFFPVSHHDVCSVFWQHLPFLASNCWNLWALSAPPPPPLISPLTMSDLRAAAVLPEGTGVSAVTHRETTYLECFFRLHWGRADTLFLGLMFQCSPL